jgi:hypothetical protein
MSDQITAQQIIDRIKKNGGSGTLDAGSLETPVTGIVTSFAASISVSRDRNREVKAAPRSQILSEPIRPFLEMDAAEPADDRKSSSAPSTGRLVGLPEKRLKPLKHGRGGKSQRLVPISRLVFTENNPPAMNPSTKHCGAKRDLSGVAG